MKTAFVFLAALALGAAAAGELQAATAPITGKHDNNAPISIASDSLQADLNAKSVTYTGNVVVTQGDTKLRANTMKVTTVNGKGDKIFANGNVVVDSPTSGTATGDSGIYSIVPRTVLMTGNVTLKKGKDVIHGAQLTVNLNTGLAALGGGAKTATGQPGGGRVQAVILPNSN